ncbi:MAG: phosphate ABC transporter permease PstA [Nitrospinae bacterium]|nr:phosphate ABC transporter permease PstA [Nitrospinota bacterium]
MKELYRTGDPLIWLTGGALAFSLLMVVGLIALIMYNGLGFFWPKDIVRYTLADGRQVMGQLSEREEIPQFGEGKKEPLWRIKVKQGNRDLYGADFIWINEADIKTEEKPAAAIVLERREWGDFIGVIKAVKDGATAIAAEPAEGWKALTGALAGQRRLFEEARALERDEVGAISYDQEKLRLANRALKLKGAKDDDPRITANLAGIDKLHKDYEAVMERVGAIRAKLTWTVVLTGAGGVEKELPLYMIVRAVKPNELSVFGKAGVYLSKIWEFISADPRESNTEGGVFPAIFGTVLMVMVMSVAVTPMGVLGAFYLREYARQGVFVSAVRIAVNNLAGVPSIVFGVFGVGFFIYFVGGSIDSLFFPEALPTPTYGTGGILWASLTLALLTVPVVIVATEEGLAAIPRNLREASLGLGATKFETMWRVVLPAVMPSILTGLILAMARAAGEVAPLMITGVVKLAPSLPIDGYFPFLHMERKFMHLGFHIYDVGFQSPNVDAARPMVYTTTLLLLGIVLALNLSAIVIRNKLKKKFATSAV